MLHKGGDVKGRGEGGVRGGLKSVTERPSIQTAINHVYKIKEEWLNREGKMGEGEGVKANSIYQRSEQKHCTHHLYVYAQSLSSS